VTTQSEDRPVADLPNSQVKKDGIEIIKWPHLLIMFPQSYQNHLEKQLKPAEYQTLQSLVYLLQSHRQVSIELLASVMPYPIQFESRRPSLQRFLKLECLNIADEVTTPSKPALVADLPNSQLKKDGVEIIK